MYIRNYMEEMVFNMIKETLKDVDVCQCGKCMMDIAAIALNSLPACYIVTEKGELYTKVNSFGGQSEVDVITAIIKAAETVKNNPRHDIS